MKLIAFRFLIVISTICIPIAFISFITEMIIRGMLTIVIFPIMYICTGNTSDFNICDVYLDESISFYILYPFIKLNKIYNNLK